MTSELQSSDGCEIPASEFLNMARIGLKSGPEASAEEFTEALKDVPDEGRSPWGLEISNDNPFLRFDWFTDADYFESLDHARLNESKISGGSGIPFFVGSAPQQQYIGRADRWKNDGHSLRVGCLVWHPSDKAADILRLENRPAVSQYCIRDHWRWS